tara:strand:- start:4413 stop:5033 length:621 start_codon:yes stop_codon:yes gene_type:complete
MRKKGRPSGVDSTETKKRILDHARIEFSVNGYDGSAISTVAERAGLAPSAIYHYFSSKKILYEAVFEDTADVIWTDVSRARFEPTLVEAVEHLIDSSRSLTGKGLKHHTNFLAAAPIEARLHPEFSMLLDRRTEFQDRTFTALAEIGQRTGELQNFSMEESIELLRALIMGWFFERHFRDEEVRGSHEAIIKLLKTVTNSSLAQRN